LSKAISQFLYGTLKGLPEDKHLRIRVVDGKLKFEFHGAKVASNAGLLAFCELDEAFRLTEKGSTVLSNSRRGKNTQHTILAMLR